jgi:hypothetical protein
MGCAGLCSWGWLGEFCVVCSAHLFVLSNYVQAGLDLVVMVVAAVRNRSRGDFPNVTWCGEAFLRMGVQGVKGLILVGALFLLHIFSCMFDYDLTFDLSRILQPQLYGHFQLGHSLMREVVLYLVRCSIV